MDRERSGDFGGSLSRGGKGAGFTSTSDSFLDSPSPSPSDNAESDGSTTLTLMLLLLVVSPRVGRTFGVTLTASSELPERTGGKPAGGL